MPPVAPKASRAQTRITHARAHGAPRGRAPITRVLVPAALVLVLLACAGGPSGSTDAAPVAPPVFAAEPIALVELPDGERPTGIALLPDGAFAASVQKLERPEGGRTMAYGGVRFRRFDGTGGLRPDIELEQDVSADAVALSPDGTRIAAARYDRVDVVPLDGGEPRYLTLDGPAAGAVAAAGGSLTSCRSPWQVEWSGPTIAVRCATGGLSVLLLDAETGARTVPVAPRSSADPYVTITDLALSADGRTLALAGTTDDFTSEPKPWVELKSLPDGALLRTIPLDRRYEDLAFSPDGARLAVSHPYFGLQVYDTATGARVAEHVYDPDEGNRGSGDVVWAPDGERLYRVGPRRGVAVHDGADARLLGFLSAHPTEPEDPLPPPPDWPTTLSARNGDLALSADGRLLASIERSDFGRAVRIWRLPAP